MAEHRKIARESLKYYRDMKQEYEKQWKEITELLSTPSSPEREEKLKVLQSEYLHIIPECGYSNV